MKVIIAGSRGVTTRAEVLQAILDSGFHVTEVVSGGARGPDQIGEWWARTVGVPVRRFPADWKTHGRAAGPIRNREMAAYADALIAVWDGESSGTADMIGEAEARGLKVFVRVVARP